MPSTTTMRYQNIPETNAPLDWADLTTIDLSDFDQPDGKARLAAQLSSALHTTGFFYVVNFGLSDSAVDEQFALVASIFDLPAEAKAPFRVNPDAKSGYFGWKPRGSRRQQHGLVDSLELYDDPKWNRIYKKGVARPKPVEDAAAATEAFCRHLHFHVLYRLLVLAAIVMELEDEEALWKMHDYEAESQCHLRYMLYHPRSAEELEIMKQYGIEHNVYGHTDFGTFTLLMRQPVAGLQVRVPGDEDGWKWVRPLQGAITVNVADTLSFLTGGFLASSVHRVVLPPEDQRGVPRYGVIYFAGPDDETLLRAVESPVLRKREGSAGSATRALPPEGVTAGEWVRVRFASIDANYANNKDNKVVVKSTEVSSYAD